MNIFRFLPYLLFPALLTISKAEEIAKLTADDPRMNQHTNGAVTIYRRNGAVPGDWEMIKVLTPPIDPNITLFGLELALDGDLLAVLAPRFVANPNSAIFVYERNEGGSDNWGEVGRIETGDFTDIALEDELLVVGAPRSEEAGSIHLFQRNMEDPNGWSGVSILRSSDMQVGNDFGDALSIDQNHALVGAVLSDTANSEAGAVYVFRLSIEGDPFRGVLLGGDFHLSNWYGIYNTTFYPWIFHVQHGWQYIFEAESEGEVFIYDLESGDFWWTSSSFPPLIFYSFGRTTFNFYFSGTSDPREFVDLETEEPWSIQ